jgi:hypothetical protein
MIIEMRRKNLIKKINKFIFKKGFIICLLIIFISLLLEQKIEAADEGTTAQMYNNGNFEFTTTDTAATTNTTWKTIGFTVRRDKSYGNPLKDKKYATFMLKPGQKDEVDIGSKKKVTFYLTKQQVNDALKGTDLETIKDNDDLYLNGIIQVHNGEHGPGPYYTLNGISNAESWNNPHDFDDRFDVHIFYRSGNQEYPVTITYQLYQSGSYNSFDVSDEGKIKNHDTFTANWKSIPKTQVNKGETYFLYRVYYQDLLSTKKLGNRKTAIDPNLDQAKYLNELAYIRDREFTVQGAKDGDGLNIVAIYRRFPAKESNEDSEEIVKEYEETDPTAIIAADTRGNEAYDVSLGIPGTESVYANVFSSQYLAGTTFTRKYGKKVYNVKVHKQYILNWTTTETKIDPITEKETTTTKDHSETRDMTYMYPIERKYSYWTITSLGVYAIDNATIENEALHGGNVTLIPSDYRLPVVSYIQSDKETDHLIEPVIKNVTVPSQTLTGSGSAPSIPSEEFKEEADKAVAKIKCKNDKLIFNGKTIITDAIKEEKTVLPGEIPSGLEDVGENVLYKSGLVIPGTKANGEYETTGTVKYKPVVEIKPDKIDQTYEIEDINSIIVYTPTVCDAQVQNNYKDNQMIKPDMSRASLVLDRPFNVTLPTTGNHQYYLGYGYRDYAKYIENRQVKFPFDVYCGNSVSGTFIPNGSWTSVGENTLFYLPSWVNEGLYTINFRSIAINASANNSIGKTEELANLELQNYVATDTVNVEVSGRIYGLNMYDISDYPIWQDVFRIPDSLSLTGFKYTVGDKDQNGNSNGNNLKYTLALVNGEHPKYSNIGAVKTGYVTRFNLKTIGNMYSGNDYVSLAPTFYYVDSSGKKRQEADIYYSETFNGKKNIMVKMGSPLDLENKKSLRTGDPYLSIPEKALNQTAYYSGLTLKDWKAQQKNIFTYTNIMLPGSLRTFVGHIANVPDGVMESAIAKSVQNWYGEYYLPSEIHVVPKGFNINEYIKNNGGLTYKENFWLKNGYIIVNFHIETIQNGKRHLSYINADNEKQGYCNMWKREGYQYKKADYKGNEFCFIDGDYVLYYTDKSAANDYTSAGTH